MCQYCSQAQAEAGEPHEKIVLSAYPGAVLARASDEQGHPITIRYAHIESAELIRPERD